MSFVLAELHKHFEERRQTLMQEAFRVVGQTKAESKLGIVRGGLREIEEAETKMKQIFQLMEEKRES